LGWTVQKSTLKRELLQKMAVGGIFRFYMGADDSGALALRLQGGRLVEDFAVDVAVGGFAVFVVVVLVVVFGGPEGGGGGEFGFDVEGLLAELVDELLGDAFLVGVEVEDGGAVLGADVGALAVELGEVVCFEEEAGEGFEGGFGGVEEDFDGFGVSGGVGADLGVGGVLGVASGVAYGGGDDAGGALEVVLGAPEAS